jgi:hypothetical protein
MREHLLLASGAAHEERHECSREHSQLDCESRRSNWGLGVADRAQVSKSDQPGQGAIAQVTGGMLRLDGVEISGTETTVRTFSAP